MPRVSNRDLAHLGFEDFWYPYGMKIGIEELNQKVMGTLTQHFSEAEAKIIADYLLWADMSGIKTHGVMKMTGTEPLQDIKPKHAIKIDRDTKLSQLIDAGAWPAPLVSQQATTAVIQKAKEHGFGIVGIHNYFSSNGAQAYYAEQIAQQDLIGIVASCPPPSTAPFNTIDPLFGTNPIGFSFPTNDDPLVFDMSTSAMTWYGLVLAKARGEKIPENMAIDKDGNPTIDPTAAMDGALLPFERGHKGSGLAMIIEILAGPLVGASYAQPEGDYGALFMAIDPNLLIDTNEFKKNCSDLIAKVKAGRTRPGTGEVRLPGEVARRMHKEAQQTGIVDIDETVLRQLGYA